MPKLVRDLMTRTIISAQPGETVEAARGKLLSHHIHHLLVVEDGTVVGVLSHRDLMATPKLKVSDVMHREVVSVDAASSLKRAAALMLGGSSGCLPVTEDGQLTGIITTTDLMRVFNPDETIG